MNISATTSYSSLFQTLTAKNNTRQTTDFAAQLAKNAVQVADRTITQTSTQTTLSSNSRLQTPFGELLLPNAESVAYLQQVANQQLEDLLKQNHIPQAPASLRYDETGALQLPADYPYANLFRNALEKNPEAARSLGNLNGLASQYAALKKISPLANALSQATTERESQQAMAQYGYLLNAESNHVDLLLQIGTDKKIRILADNESLLDNMKN